MLPPDTSLKHLAELHLHCRRQRTQQRTEDLVARAVTAVEDILARRSDDPSEPRCSGMESRSMVAS
jgi:hypothetical protein